jgi:hypothetical protein
LKVKKDPTKSFIGGVNTGKRVAVELQNQEELNHYPLLIVKEKNRNGI